MYGILYGLMYGIVSTTGTTSSTLHMSDEGMKLDHGKRRGAALVSVSTRLLVDCMGHYSPVVRQMRGKTRPEGMVLVVGSCATGDERRISLRDRGGTGERQGRSQGAPLPPAAF